MNPVVAAYLARTDRAMNARPSLLRTMTEQEFGVAEELVAGVEVDIENGTLPDGFRLP